MVRMRLEIVCLLSAVFLAVLVEGKDPELRIGVKKRPETCDMRSKNGDRLSMHYTVGACIKAYLHASIHIHLCLREPWKMVLSSTAAFLVINHFSLLWDLVKSSKVYFRYRLCRESTVNLYLYCNAVFL